MSNMFGYVYLTRWKIISVMILWSVTVLEIEFVLKRKERNCESVIIVWKKKSPINYNLQNIFHRLLIHGRLKLLRAYINKSAATLNLNKLLHVYLHSKADRWSVVPWTPGAYPLTYIACKYRSKHQNNTRPRPVFADGNFDRIKLR